MPKNVKCKNCLILTNHWCDLVVDSPDEDLVRDCQYFCQKTNGDRIRGMTDAELEKFIGSDSLCEHISTEHNEWCRCHNNCTDCIVEWLQQPAEVDADET